MHYFCFKNQQLKFIVAGLFFIFTAILAGAQPPADTLPSGEPVQQPSTQVATSGAPVLQKMDSLLGQNRFLNSKGTPVSVYQNRRQPVSDNNTFYLLAGLLLFFGIIKTVFDKYFSTLFRVFFNSSLRQGQLTDQLMQAKLPSLLFNMLFVFSAGMYVYFLLRNHFMQPAQTFNWWLLLFSIAAFVAVYSIKFVGIKVLSAVTGFKTEGDTYIFIVFLVNKIIGILLLPVLAVLAFSDAVLVKGMLPVSMVIIALLMLFRFIRSYSLLQSRLKVNAFHFMLYIFSFEVLPVIVIYKAVGFFVLKNG